jgi:hypothetical protein
MNSSAKVAIGIPHFFILAKSIPDSFRSSIEAADDCSFLFKN